MKFCVPTVHVPVCFLTNVDIVNLLCAISSEHKLWKLFSFLFYYILKVPWSLLVSLRQFSFSLIIEWQIFKPHFFFIWSIIQLSKNVHRTIKTINYRYVKTKQELKTICSVWTLLIMVLLFFIRGAYRFLPTACFRKNLRFSLYLRILYKAKAWF